jgi:hypothetical protein
MPFIVGQAQKLLGACAPERGWPTAKAVCGSLVSIERLHFYGTSTSWEKYEENTTMCASKFCIGGTFPNFDAHMVVFSSYFSQDVEIP